MGKTHINVILTCMRVCYITSYFILPFSVKLLLFNVTLL